MWATAVLCLLHEFLQPHIRQILTVPPRILKWVNSNRLVLAKLVHEAKMQDNKCYKIHASDTVDAVSHAALSPCSPPQSPHFDDVMLHRVYIVSTALKPEMSRMQACDGHQNYTLLKGSTAKHFICIFSDQIFTAPTFYEVKISTDTYNIAFFIFIFTTL